MAKIALHRRRGTKKSKSCLAQNGMLKAILGGMVLIAIGLSLGVVVGMMAYSTDTSNHLRKAAVAVDSSAGAAANDNAAEVPDSQKQQQPIKPQAGDSIPAMTYKNLAERK